MGGSPTPSTPVPAPSIPSPQPRGKITIIADYPDSPSSWFGHVWIRIEGSGTFGFYPRGVQSDTERPGSVYHCWMREYKQLAQAADVVRAFNGVSYHLTQDNCVSMVRNIAMVIGLNAPSASLKAPAEWLGDLIAANIGSGGTNKC